MRTKPRATPPTTPGSSGLAYTDSRARIGRWSEGYRPRSSRSASVANASTDTPRRDERVVDPPTVDEASEVGETRLRPVPEVGGGRGVAQLGAVAGRSAAGDSAVFGAIPAGFAVVPADFAVVPDEDPVRLRPGRTVEVADEDDRESLAVPASGSVARRERREPLAKQAGGLAPRAGAHVVEVGVDDAERGVAVAGAYPRPRRDPRVSRPPSGRRGLGGLGEPERVAVDDLPAVAPDADRASLALAVRLAAPPDELVRREPVPEVAALFGDRLLKRGDVGPVKADEPPDGVSAVVPGVVVVAAVGVADVVAQHPDRGHYRWGRWGAD